MTPITSRHFKFAVPLNVELVLDFPVGEIEVRGIEGDELLARLEIQCPVGNSSCTRRAETVEFVVQSKSDTVRLGLTRDGMTGYRNQHVTLEIDVPLSRKLHIMTGAGALLVTGVKGCLSVDMFAGEASVYVPADRIGSVVLDAGVGDASLRFADGRQFEGRRALLVGAEVDWGGGAGPCNLAIDLQFGSINAVMQ